MMGLLCAALLASCGRPQAAPPASAAMCIMRVGGGQVQDAQGRPLVWHGATTPALKDMPNPGAILQDLSQRGAKLARLPIFDPEQTPTFVPGKVQPFAAQAASLGMVTVLSWQNDPSAKPDDQADLAEDWLRLALTYMRNTPGVWLEPFASPIQTANAKRQKAIFQRMVDVVRGLGADNMILISNADWLLDPDPELASPLQGANVVYGVADAARAGQIAARGLPVVVMALAAPPAQPLPGSSISAVSASPAAFETFWKTSAGCKSGVRSQGSADRE